ncbi:ATP-binding protein [Escherichia coli]|uniref:hypothetical protein n=1 Tax=Escherichia coli TaxID=562 RepID=UPI0010E391BA|nr:hypothetical protein [Escherichia coli]GDM91015.1 ATP-binding protein [Escherichia coli]
MSNAAMKLNETSSDAYEKLEALLSPDVIKLKHYVDKGEYLLVLAKDLFGIPEMDPKMAVPVFKTKTSYL